MKSGRQHRWDVTYQSGSFHRNNTPIFLRAAEYQYYRDRAENWEARIAQIREARVNAITFYIPWRHHQPDRSMEEPDFTGRSRENRDVPRFVRLIAEAGLMAIAKPGPFVHSELNIGGLPDWTSPSAAPAVEPMRRWDGSPLTWEYDRSILPAPYAEPFLSESLKWLGAVSRILEPFRAPAGPLVAIQINDETLYCASNSPPWMMGYEKSTLEHYMREDPDTPARRWLDGDAPASSLSWSAPTDAPNRREWDNRIAWARYQTWIRSDTYRIYREALKLDLPYLSNYAGMTPPIEENVPHRDALTLHETRSPFTALSSRYADWWIAHNPIELDRDLCHYGFISWLGVTPYNIADPRTVDPDHPVVPNSVFSRYINTATRGRGINMEENWGFASLYHPYSRHAFIPIFQTLVSIAGGATGYVAFCAVSHGYWEESLDRTTKLQHPHFPSAAPIGPDGEERPLYGAMRELNRWLAVHGDDLVRFRRHEDMCFAVYQPYSALASWCERWPADDPPPFQGHPGLETLSNSAQEVGYVPSWIGLDGRETIDPREHPRVVLVLWRAMEERVQHLLASYIEAGGMLYYAGRMPEEEWDGSGCTVLRDAWARHPDRVVALAPALTDPVTTPEETEALLHGVGVRARVPLEPGARVLLYEGETREEFIFFFAYDRSRDHTMRTGAATITVAAGAKCCGVLRVSGSRLVAWYIKGVNEVEDTRALVTVTTEEESREFSGDTSSASESSGLRPVTSLHAE
ncbi:MAG: hypothetical protein EA427_02985 [Spirochaetaceae bacterium]|nr:MAG: hypothetical protein EA427_02985 [Spirochaetaceae bacterium]